MTLGAAKEQKLNQASAITVKEEFARLPRHWKNGRWLNRNNRYVLKCTERLEQDVGVGSHVRHGDLRPYVAASVVIHTMDGWSYVARALQATLAGDADAARHLGYYAELRAAMSLLASEGIGVFSRDHFVVRTTPDCAHIKQPGTHVFVWEALQHWAAQPASANLILDVIQPGGVSLSEWLKHFPGGGGAATAALLANRWLIDWGLDLQQLADDQKTRNVASYRPTTLPLRLPYPTKAAVTFVQTLWATLEPSEHMPFKVLDRHLLRTSLATIFQQLHTSNRHPKHAPSQFARLVDLLLHAVAPGDLSPEAWTQFLSFKTRPSPLLLLERASGKSTPLQPLHHLEVIARALLLLRLSTGASRRLIQGIDSADTASLAFWWNRLGEERGFWGAGTPVNPLTDLWKDVEEALQRFSEWRQGPQTNASLHEILSANAEAMRILSSSERVGLWSLGL